MKPDWSLRHYNMESIAATNDLMKNSQKVLGWVGLGWVGLGWAGLGKVGHTHTHTHTLNNKSAFNLKPVVRRRRRRRRIEG